MARCRALAAVDATRLERHASAREDDPGLAVLIGLYAGLRRAEIAGVAWEHFQFSGRSPVWLRVAGKGDSPTCPCTPSSPKCSFAGCPVALDGFLFPGKRGAVCPPRSGTGSTTSALPSTFPSSRPTCSATPPWPRPTTAGRPPRRAALRPPRQARTTLVYTRTTAERLIAVVGVIDYGPGSRGVKALRDIAVVLGVIVLAPLAIVAGYVLSLLLWGAAGEALGRLARKVKWPTSP